VARLLEAEERARALADLPGWVDADGAELTRDYASSDFRVLAAVVVEVADAAEQMNHHPDIYLRWGHLTFTLSTHFAEGVTELDVELAHRIAAAAAAHGAS
jgi:4a-hydroxytetrahydrobiopterin dehydratase